MQRQGCRGVETSLVRGELRNDYIIFPIQMTIKPMVKKKKILMTKKRVSRKLLKSAYTTPIALTCS